MSRARELSNFVNPAAISVDGSFNVGINSQTPDVKLDVVGVVSATSFTGDGANISNVSASSATEAGGLTGTPDIDVRNVTGTAGTFSGPLNIDDTTESSSISTGALIVDGGVGIAKSLHVGGNLSVGGTLTYEDVTNVDSLGIITARQGVHFGEAGAGTLVEGNATGIGIGTDNPGVDLAIRNTGFAGLDIQSDRLSGTIGGIRWLNSAGDNRANIYGLVDEQIILETGGDERVRIGSAGSFAIGSQAINENFAVGGAPGGGTGALNVYTQNSGNWAAQIRMDSNNGNGLFLRGGGSNSNHFPLYVSNANEANSILVVTGNERVGIGTTVPDEEFHIFSSAYTGLILESGRTTTTQKIGGLQFHGNGDTEVGAYQCTVGGDLVLRSGGTTERLRITSSGVVGVGTVGQNWRNASYAGVLQVAHGSLSAQDIDDGATSVQNNAYFDQTNNRWEYIRDDAAEQISFVSGFTIFNRAVEGTADSAITWNESARISAGGSFGIGTNDPQCLLHLEGNKSSDTKAKIILADNQSGNGDFYFESAGSGSENHLIIGEGSDPMILVVGDVAGGGTGTRGYVGINTTVPRETVSIAGTIRVENTTNSDERLLITHQGIDFQNTGGGSSTGASAHLLDDYEEGTYTVSLTPGSGSITLNSSQDTFAYTKIGRLVYIQGFITVSSTSTASGSLSFNIPFNADLSLPEQADNGHMPIIVNNTSKDCDRFAAAYNNTTSMSIVTTDSATAASASVADLMTGSVNIIVSFCYLAST